MELHSMNKIFHPHHLGEEKQQMLNLNRRLETYLNRVKVLEEENMMLAKEIQAIRHNDQGRSMLRKGLEKQLHQARLEVDAAWRDRVLTELEVGKLTEELEALNLQRHREAEAKQMAMKNLEHSRKELDEEKRAQLWLREKVNQLEHEMRLLIQTHEEDVAHLESALTQSRTTVPPAFTQRGNQTPDLIKMGQEFSQKATRAWQEAAEAYQGQLVRLEESLDQARGRLSQVNQEKLESQLQIQALEKEIASSLDVRLHLEKTTAQRRDEYGLEIQKLQEHLEGLEVEKEQLGHQIDHLLQENRSLMQMKMSLGLEVATYRTLLDGESLRGDAGLMKKPRNISITDAVFSPRGVSVSYHNQLSAGRKSTSSSSVCPVAPKGTIPAAFRSRNPECSSTQPADVTKPKTLESPSPKRIQEEVVENVRRQEFKVTNVEPLLTSYELKASAAALEEKDGSGSSVVEDLEEVTESVVSCQVESGLSSEPCFSDEAGLHQFLEHSMLLKSDRATEEPNSFSDDMENYPGEEIVETEGEGRDEVEETRDSEIEVTLEPTTECMSSSVDSECEPTQEMTGDAAGEGMQEVMEDKPYPDGEEMDTWDSVIERRVDVKTEEELKHEGKTQHAEPEEDISAKETRRAMNQINQDPIAASSQVNGCQHGSLDQDEAPPSGNEEEDEDDDEDSQNVSVSWRTELESDSYAQDNTLADTRPLIRYKSDETDAHTQASHLDESESSDGEQERKAEEVGTWSEGKSKTFGTMEDLCEEVEDESVDDEYNPEDRDVSQNTVISEHAGGENDLEDEDGSARNLDRETEDLTVTQGLKLEEEELEMDILVEEELENQTSSDAHFLQWPVNQDLSHNEEQEFERATAEDISATEKQAAINGSSVEEHEVEPKNQEADQEPTVSSLMCAAGREDPTAFLISSDEPADPECVVALKEEDIEIQDVVNTNEVTEVPPHPPEEEEEEEAHAFPENAEWDVLEDPTYHFKTDQDRKFIHQESADSNPETQEEETDIFIVPSDNKPRDFFSSGVKNDFWVSSLEGGATYKPSDSCKEAEEEEDPNQGVHRADESFENPNVVNGNSIVVADSSKSLAAVKDPTQGSVEVKRACQKFFEGKIIHSEDSEIEAESWSSGEEAAERNPFLDSKY
ncbi:Nestin [Oryzias melastigma]|uniref:Nestin n=1 Tax=Oryzias melastigma TaxID=30732 RepID=A0A834KW95_ORYME|nr:Nestin [Oryzias melastigma]